MLPTLPIAPRDFCKPSTSTPAPRIRVAPALDLPSPQTPAIPAPLPIQARVRIRLTRLGRKKLPFYRIIAIDSRKRREGRPLQFLGWYNPFSKELVVNGEAVKLWLSCGAQPSDTARSLLVKAGVVEPFVRARDLPRSQPWPATLVGRGKPKKDGAGEGGEGAEEEAVEKAAAEGGKGVEDDEEHAADEAVQ